MTAPALPALVDIGEAAQWVVMLTADDVQAPADVRTSTMILWRRLVGGTDEEALALAHAIVDRTAPGLPVLAYLTPF